MRPAPARCPPRLPPGRPRGQSAHSCTPWRAWRDSTSPPNCLRSRVPSAGRRAGLECARAEVCVEEVGVDEVAVKARTHIDYQVIDVIARRWSPFAFDPERDVPESSVRSMLEAARWAPSARNEQPWRFLVIDRSSADARAKIESCLSEGNAWAKRAPLFLMAVAKTDYSANPEPNPW